MCQNITIQRIVTNTEILGIDKLQGEDKPATFHIVSQKEAVNHAIFVYRRNTKLGLFVVFQKLNTF